MWRFIITIVLVMTLIGILTATFSYCVEDSFYCDIHLNNKKACIVHLLSRMDIIQPEIGQLLSNSAYLYDNKAQKQTTASRKQCKSCSYWWFPDGYDRAQWQISMLSPGLQQKQNHVIWVLPGSDHFVCKKRLPEICFDLYGEYAWTFLPKSITLNLSIQDEKDLKNKNFILKKNIQRQKGLLLVSSLEEAKRILLHRTSPYVVAQQIITDVYRVQGRKINCRVYMSVILSKDTIKGYYYCDGFMYYTNGTGNELNETDVVTTGYIERDVYETCPLTIQDWLLHKDTDPSYRSLFFKQTVHALKNILAAWSKTVGKSLRKCKHKASYVQWFGVDVQPHQYLDHVSIIEINKAPNIAPHSARDKMLKENMISSLFNLTLSNPDGRTQDGQTPDEKINDWIPFCVLAI